MKKLTFPFTLPILIVLLLQSCEKIERVEDYGDIKPKITLNAILTANQPIEVTVNRSLNALDNAKIRDITNANVEVYKNGVFLCKLKYSTTTNLGVPAYICDSLAEKDANYTFKVTAPKFPSAESFTTVASPFLNSQPTLIYESYKREAFAYGSNDSSISINAKIKLEFELNNNKTKKEYYIVRCGVNNNTYYFSGTPKLNIPNSFEVNGYFLFTNDLLRVGMNKISISFSDLFYGYRTSTSSDKPKLLYEIYSVSESYFKYAQTIIPYIENNQGLFGPSVLQTFQEPTQIYSNVTNGYGIIGSVWPVDGTILLK